MHAHVLSSASKERLIPLEREQGELRKLVKMETNSQDSEPLTVEIRSNPQILVDELVKRGSQRRRKHGELKPPSNASEEPARLVEVEIEGDINRHSLYFKLSTPSP